MCIFSLLVNLLINILFWNDNVHVWSLFIRCTVILKADGIFWHVCYWINICRLTYRKVYWLIPDMLLFILTSTAYYLALDCVQENSCLFMYNLDKYTHLFYLQGFCDDAWNQYRVICDGQGFHLCLFNSNTCSSSSHWISCF